MCRKILSAHAHVPLKMLSPYSHVPHATLIIGCIPLYWRRKPWFRTWKFPRDNLASEPLWRHVASSSRFLQVIVLSSPYSFFFFLYLSHSPASKPGNSARIFPVFHSGALKEEGELFPSCLSLSLCVFLWLWFSTLLICGSVGWPPNRWGVGYSIQYIVPNLAGRGTVVGSWL